jgi:hypothetical protein
MSQTIAQLVGNDASTGFTFSSNVILASTNSSERFRVDSSGRLLIGTSSSIPVAALASGCKLQIETTDVGFTMPFGFSSIRHGGTSGVSGSIIFLGRSRGTTPGSFDSVVDGDTLGYVVFSGANGSNFSNVAAWITAQVDGTVSGGGANDMPGRLVFSTTPDGAFSPTERARITSAGDLLIGKTTTTANGGKLQISNGITFPATQVACTDANTLDDYEEGIATVSLVCGSGSITLNSSYNKLLYTKIGRVVTVTGFLNILYTSSPSGTLQITGLPFTANNSSSNQASTSFFVYEMDTATLLMGYVQPNTTTIKLSTFDNGSRTDNIASYFQDDYSFTVSLTYFV